MYMSAGNVWAEATSEIISLKCIYRTKPKQLAVPWDVLREDIVCVAMDEDGGVFAYDSEVEREGSYWADESANAYLLDILKIDTIGIDWKTSKIMRPTKETT